MNPVVSHIQTIKNNSSCVIQGVDVSVVNAIRRTMLTDIETLVFRGFPNNANNINISKNTTKFNNEYLKHRISCIPISNAENMQLESVIEKYVVELNVANRSSEKLHVTTKDFKIKNKNSDQYLSEELVRQYFPPDETTGDYILVAILYPNFNKKNESEVEELNIEMKLDIGTSGENSCWNVVQNAAYENYRNDAIIKEKLLEIEAKYSENPEDQVKMKMEKRDFEILDAQRFFNPDEFIFSFAGIGVYSNNELYSKAVKLINKKIGYIHQFFDQSIINGDNDIQTKDEYEYKRTNGLLTTEELQEIRGRYCDIYKDDDFVVFRLFQDDYTIGKLIEKYFNRKYQNMLDYIGFKKEHPTKKDALIYIRFKDELPYSELMNLFKSLTTDIMHIFNELESIKF